MYLPKTATLIHLTVLLIAIAMASMFFVFAPQIGSFSVLNRALLAEVSVLLALVGLFPFIPWFSSRLKVYLGIVCVPAVLVCGWYFLSFLPSQAVGGITGEQLASDLISERNSNGIIEIGFAYPIFTPTIRIENNELFTKEVNIFLRILDANNEAALFRAVRGTMPDARLSVEATVAGLLSENSGFLFIPIVIPPGGSVEGKMVFIISDLNDGTTFNEALGRRYPANFEIREPETGELLFSFPMSRI